MADQQRDQRRQERRWRLVDLTAPDKTVYVSGMPEIMATASVNWGGIIPIDRPKPQCQWILGSKAPVAGTITESGVATKVFPLGGEAIGSHTLTFQLLTDPIQTRSVSFYLPPPPKAPKQTCSDIQYAYRGSAGNYVLEVRLVDASGNPFGGKLEVSYAGKHEIVEIPEAGKTHRVKFEAEKETVRLKVVEAPSIIKEDALDGRAFTGEPPLPPKPKPGDSRWAFLRYRSRTGKQFDSKTGRWS